MKKLLLILVLAFMCSSAARANDFYDGLDVAKKNEFNQYLEMWKSEVRQLKPTPNIKERWITYARGYDPLAKKELAGTLKSAMENQANIGREYYQGTIVNKDYKKAMWWFRLAAEQGHRMSQYDLAVMYQRGDGLLMADYKESEKWFRRAAEQGFGEAQIKLGDMYKEGHGVMQNYKESVKWYLMAAEHVTFRSDHVIARLKLAEMYQKGDGVKQNYKESIKWYRKISFLPKTRLSLGYMYENGLGVKQDYVRAHMWYNLAAGMGYSSGTDKREIVAKKMTFSQISKAQDMARECMKAYKVKYIWTCE